MPQHKSAKKRLRRNGAREELNTARKSRIRTFIRKAREAIAGGDTAAAATAFNDSMAEIQRGVAKGVMHKNTASRTISRLNASMVKAQKTA